jgi:wyosine [tRNA(Phe)-imidazoG37] synthetase (radical SAM superfamily)
MPERPTSPNVLYGPVPSRRLGYSLGVDILPFKTCSMDCVYCQLGASAKTTVRRREYVSARTALTQIRKALASGQRIDAITFSGSGEPTLNAGIGTIIRGIKRSTRIPVVVLTNSSCLVSPEVRRELLGADIVVPSLDAATDAVFRKVNRPHAGLTAAGIIAGLAAFRREFKGRIWLEIMLVRGVNDGPGHLRKLKAAAALIRPDRIQLNTVVRPPAERRARPLGPEELERIRDFFGEGAEIIADFKTPGRTVLQSRDEPSAHHSPVVTCHGRVRRKQIPGRSPGPRPPGTGDDEADVLAVAGRRPVTVADLALSLGRPVEEIAALIGRLAAAGKIRAVPHNEAIYWETA